MARNYKAVARKEFLEEIYKVSSKIGEIVGSTMTANGEYVILHDGSSTNDGAKIISRLNQINFGDNKIQKMFVSKLIEATEKTDELAGDGTSATTIFTSKLIEYIKNIKEEEFIVPKVIEELNIAEDIFLKSLENSRKKLETEQDYINLATVSVKDKKLGEMIGKAIYSAGENAALQIRMAEDRPEDYVKKNSHYFIPYSSVGYGVPEEIDEVEVIVIDSIITDQDQALKQILTHTYSNRKKVLLIAKEVDETAWQLIIAANKENSNLGVLGFIQAPELSKTHTARKVLEDVAAYVGTTVETKQQFISNSNKVAEIKFGSLDKFKMDANGTYLSRKELSKESKELIEKLNDEIKSLSEDMNKEKISILKQRINMLNGTTITIYIFERTSSALETKVDRIQDAVKATQFSLGYGYVYGAGSFYKYVVENDKTRNELVSRLVFEYIATLKKAIGSKKNVVELEIKSNNVLYINEKGDIEYGNITKTGIIDSARVIENVIKNSFTVAKEFARIGTMIVMEEEINE